MRILTASSLHFALVFGAGFVLGVGQTVVLRAAISHSLGVTL
jgi:hypothetical protein